MYRDRRNHWRLHLKDYHDADIYEKLTEMLHLLTETVRWLEAITNALEEDY